MEVLVTDLSAPGLDSLEEGSRLTASAEPWPVPARMLRLPDGPRLTLTEELFYGTPALRLPRSVGRSFVRRARPVYGLYQPSPDDSLLGILFECILEQGRFDPVHRRRLETLMSWPALLDEFHLSRTLDGCFNRPGLWDLMRSCIYGEDYGSLLALAPSMASALRAESRE